MRVEQIMTKNPVVAKLPGKRQDVLNLMIKHKKTGLPVVKKDGTLVGLVARHHLFAMPDADQLAMLVRKDHPFVTKETDVRDAALLILENDLHHLPVINRNNKVAGIVTPADFLQLVEGMRSEVPVEDFVRAPCVAVFEETPLKVASEILRLGKVFALAVLDGNAKLTGIITDRDIFGRAVVKKKRTISSLGLPREDDPWDYEGLRNVMRLLYDEKKVGLPDVPVKDAMVKSPATVFRKSSISEAARVMRRGDFGQLPITDAQDNLHAMVYDTDMLVALLGKEG